MTIRIIPTISLSLCMAAMACAGAQSDRPAAAGSRAATSNETGATAAAAQEALQGLEAAKLTSAPLRARAIARLDAPVDDVWGYVANHDNLVEYGAPTGLKHVSIDNSNADAPGGVGCKRECLANENDRFVEEVLYFRPPYVFAYSATENTWGLTEHLGVVIVRPTADGKSELEWRQYFNTAKPDMTEMMSQNMQGMLSGPLLGFFVERFGGEVLHG